MPRVKAHPETVAVQRECICFTWNDGIERDRWRLKFSDILAIGEATDAQHRIRSEYRGIYLVRPPYHWEHFTFSAAGADQVIKELERRFDVQIRATLPNVRAFASRVIWPTSLAGQPMFEVRTMRMGILDWVLGPSAAEWNLAAGLSAAIRTEA